MTIILDADVIISGEKGTFDLQGWVASKAEDQFEVAAITVAEFWHGVERASRPHNAKRHQYLEAVLAAFAHCSLHGAHSLRARAHLGAIGRVR
jgi:hypothetical protein